MENAVYQHLKINNYNVYIGKLVEQKIAFILLNFILLINKYL